VVGWLIWTARSTPTWSATELEHGSYEATVKRHMSESTARKLSAIAKDEIFSNRERVHVLPPSWFVLYELTKLPDELKLACLKDGTIHPNMERNDAMAIRDRHNLNIATVKAASHRAAC
jgi:hypothetical protein